MYDDVNIDPFLKYGELGPDDPDVMFQQQSAKSVLAADRGLHFLVYGS